MTKIRAAICREFGAPLSVEDVTLRALVGAEVEVTVDAVAICHSDITFADGSWGGDLPAVYGHEAAGRVTAVGPLALDIAVGTPVIATLIRACGTCPCCAAGKPVICQGDRTSDPTLTDANGTSLETPLRIGGFAERVIVDRSQIAPVPDAMPAASASLLACGVVTGVGAMVNAAALRAGEDVVVIGAGGVGLNAIQGARIAGARRIVAVDLTEEKLADARAFGATDGVLATVEAPWDAVHGVLGKGADVVAVTVGIAPVYGTAPLYLASGGRLVMVGMPATGAKTEYEPGNFASAGQTMIGSKMGDVVLSRDIPWLVDLYGQGRLSLDEMVSKTWSLDQINEAIADTRAGSARRNVIVF